MANILCLHNVTLLNFVQLPLERVEEGILVEVMFQHYVTPCVCVDTRCICTIQLPTPTTVLPREKPVSCKGYHCFNSILKCMCAFVTHRFPSQLLPLNGNSLLSARYWDVCDNSMLRNTVNRLVHVVCYILCPLFYIVGYTES